MSVERPDPDELLRRFEERQASRRTREPERLPEPAKPLGVDIAPIGVKVRLRFDRAVNDVQITPNGARLWAQKLLEAAAAVERGLKSA
jgi:hypothetical protein